MADMDHGGLTDEYSRDDVEVYEMFPPAGSSNSRPDIGSIVGKPKIPERVRRDDEWKELEVGQAQDKDLAWFYFRLDDGDREMFRNHGIDINGDFREEKPDPAPALPNPATLAELT